MIPTPCAFSSPITRKRRSTSSLGERGGGLVHDQDARVGPQGAGDLDQLLLGHAQAAGWSVGVDRRADPVEQALAARRRRSPQRTRRHAPAGSRPRAMFSATVRSGKSAGCW